MNKYWTCPALGLMTLMSVAGCTYNGKIREQLPISTATASDDKKIPRNVVIIPNNATYSSQFRIVGAGGTSVNIDLYPGVPNAVQAELAKVFSDVAVVENSKPANGDIAVGMSVKIRELSRDAWTGTYQFEGDLDLAFKDLTTGTRISSIRESKQAVYTPSGEANAAAFLTGFSLFLLSPFTIPWQTDALGRHAVEVMEDTVQRLVQNLADDVRSDPRLGAYLRGGVTAVESGSVQPTRSVVPAIVSDIDTPSYRNPEDPNQYAIVVGIEKYLSDIPEAQFANRDAQAMRDHLVALGYPPRNIKFLTDGRASKSSMEAYLEDWLPKNVNSDSRVFFYFSGHGAPDVESNQAYLVPADGDPSYLKKTGFPLKRLYADLNALPVKRVVIALDSCFSGAGGRSVLAEGTRPLISTIDTGISRDSKLLLFAAASSSQITSTIRDKGHGSFTYYFLKGLGGSAADKNGVVTARSLFDYLKPKVEDEASRQNREQTPMIEGVGSTELARFQ